MLERNCAMNIFYCSHALLQAAEGLSRQRQWRCWDSRYR